MSATVAYVTPSVLKWARERCGISVEQLAQKVNTKPDRLTAWENGEKRPTMRQAEHVAGALHVPFGYLFLTAPPKEQLPVADFRVGHAASGVISPDLMEVLNDAILKRDWYREFLSEEGRAAELPYVGSFTPSTNHEDVANRIRKAVGINATLRADTSGWDDFLSKVVRRCENIGILVMRSGIVGGNPHRHLRVEEFRGFALADKLAPVIFINGVDARAAQIFTLAHELAHLWIGQSGISDEKMDRPEKPTDNNVERFCNSVAAEVLVPAAELTWDENKEVGANVQAISKTFRVSRLVALKRGFDLGKINRAVFQQHYKVTEAQYKEKEADASGGNFYPTLFVRNSATFTRTLVGAVNEGKALYREAAQLLNVKPDTINKVIEYIEVGA